MKNKVIILSSIIIGVLVLTLSLTFAILTFDQTKGNSQLVLGDIWMKYSESSGINIQGAMPGAAYSNYFEFTISGKNTYTKNDIYYDFLLVRGDIPSGKTEENRIPDKYLKFKLVSVDSNNQETVLLSDKTYPDLTNERIYVETISKNTTSKVDRKYRLYMTIDSSLEIGNSESAVFTPEEWDNAFASVKLNVTGDFNPKEVNPYNECFATRTLSDGTIEITDYYIYYDYMSESRKEDYIDNKLYQNPICTTDVTIPSSINGAIVTSIGENAFKNKFLTSVTFPETITTIGDYAFRNNSLKTVTLPNSVTTLGESVCNYCDVLNIGNNITYIKGSMSNVHGTSLDVNIDKTCAEIEQITISPTDSSSDYPWFSEIHSYELNGTDGVCFQGDDMLLGGGD